MEWLDILQRIGAGEDQNTEFKRGVGDLSAIGKTMCAFANGEGGIIVLGVDDSGTIVGVNEDPDTLQERLTSFLHTGCSKPVTSVCGFRATASGCVHWIDVRRHQCGYDPFSYNGRFWIRRGRASVAPSPSELQDLLNTFGLVFTEKQVVPTATVQDLDLDEFYSFMRAQGKDTEEEPQPEIESDLNNASVADDFEGALRPTLYGLMAFGKNPQAHPHTTNLFIQCAAYKGTDRGSDVVLVGESKGRLVEQVRRTGDWVRSLGWRERYHGFVREDVPIIPNNILREALVNAVIHRDYAITGSKVQVEIFSDRIDVTSPGTLPNHMTVENARSGGTARSRNEMMANAMVVWRFMEQRGRGWLMMRREMRRFNDTEPELVNDERNRFVRVTFRLEPSSARNNV